MRPIDADAAETLILKESEKRANFYNKELKAFLDSGADCAEIDKPSHDISVNSAVGNYRKYAARANLDIAIIVRRGRIYAYKREVFNRLQREIKAAFYASRVIDYVESKEETLKYL